MPSRNNKPILNALVTFPVTLIVLGALALSAGSMLENIRFARSTTQILGFADKVREAAGQQASFAQSQGEDLWMDLISAGRLPSDVVRTNPWTGQMRAYTVPTSNGPVAMRIENDMPANDCRRIALYFLDQNPTDLGILSIEAQTPDADKWTLIYPLSTPLYDRAAMFACGKENYSRFALVLKIK